ncbi:MAG: precorrin-6y C5,15-methyltransferase (decarboxylating) subunit CbiE, partial [Proteobacteria bacterium]|nr:precorrin-6y C5,15-methyltransferase (decarboxylating) subunit CbiE [Pseudomonadota bacterium]
MTEACQVIGVLDNGAEGLSAGALAYVSEADVVIGGARTLALMQSHLSKQVSTHDFSGKLTQVPQWVQQAQADNKRVVVLATGDPLCHGIGKYLVAKLGADNCEIVPNVSIVQLACARLGVAWQEIKICSIHGKDAGEWLPGADKAHGLYALLQATRGYDALAVFTGPENTPGRIARMLQLEGMAGDWRMSVVTQIHQQGESIHRDIDIDVAAKTDFADPNIVLLQRSDAVEQPVLFGLADDRYKQRKPDKGLITKREVRAVSLARMQLRADSIVWDIGAATGSVGLEAARLCPKGHVYAIEKNEADAAIALENKQSMAVSNYSLLNSKAPAGMETWPAPDAVFVGGSGGELADLIELCLQRLNTQGWLVMNFVTLENLSTAVE